MAASVEAAGYPTAAAAESGSYTAGDEQADSGSAGGGSAGSGVSAAAQAALCRILSLRFADAQTRHRLLAAFAHPEIAALCSAVPDDDTLAGALTAWAARAAAAGGTDAGAGSPAAPPPPPPPAAGAGPPRPPAAAPPPPPAAHGARAPLGELGVNAHAQRSPAQLKEVRIHVGDDAAVSGSPRTPTGSRGRRIAPVGTEAAAGGGSRCGRWSGCGGAAGQRDASAADCSPHAALSLSLGRAARSRSSAAAAARDRTPRGGTWSHERRFMRPQGWASYIFDEDFEVMQRRARGRAEGPGNTWSPSAARARRSVTPAWNTAECASPGPAAYTPSWAVASAGRSAAAVRQPRAAAAASPAAARRRRRS